MRCGKNVRFHQQIYVFILLNQRRILFFIYQYVEEIAFIVKLSYTHLFS